MSTPEPRTCSAVSTQSYTSPAPPALPLTSGGERYEVVRLHARGGMGEVLVAVDQELGRQVAFKQIQAQFADNHTAVQRFLLEAEVTGRLEHPGIVPIYGLGVQADGRHFYTMRFIEGVSLREAIRDFHQADSRGRSPGERELALRGLLKRFIDVCNAVAFAHERGWLHRDIKPANVMLGPFGETLLVDWGLARKLGGVGPESNASTPLAAPSHADSTQQGTVVGTPAYMSPEQASGRLEALGPPSDVFALGATLYELLTGHPPRDGSIEEALSQAQQGQFVSPRQRLRSIPSALEAILLRAMALRPEQRYAKASDLAHDVERWLADEPVQAYREPWRARLRRWMRHHRTFTGVVLALVLATTLGLGVGLWLVNRERERTARAEQETRAALELSQRAEQSAREQRQLALATIASVLDDIDGGLRHLPGAQPLRQELLLGAIRSLEKVARATDTAEKVDQQQIRVHVDLGQLFLRLEGAGTARAKEQFEKALSLAEQLVKANPDDLSVQRDRAACLQHLGLVQTRMGAHEEAYASLKRAREFFDVAQTSQITEPQNRQNLAATLICEGDAQLLKGESGAATASYRQAAAICRQLIAEGVVMSRTRMSLAAAIQRLGNAHLARCDSRAALAAYQEAHAILSALAAAHPQHMGYSTDRAIIFGKLAEAHHKLGNLAQAEELTRQGLELAQSLQKKDPHNTDVRTAQLHHLNLLGDLHLLRGETTAALDSFRQCQEVARGLSEKNPSDVESLQFLGLALIKLGKAQAVAAQADRAQGTFQEGVTILRRVAGTNRQSATARRDLSVALLHLGDSLVKVDAPSALKHYQEAREIRRELARSRPDHPQGQHELAVAVSKCGEAHLKLGQASPALKAFESALEIVRSLRAKDPRDAEIHRDLTVFLEHWGDAKFLRGDMKAAQEAFVEVHELRQPRAEEDLKNAQIQRDLMVARFKLGNWHQHHDEYAAAAQWYQKGLEGARRSPAVDLLKPDATLLEQRLRFCEAVEQTLKDPASLKPDAWMRADVLYHACRATARRNELTQGLVLADLLEKESKDARSLYLAACCRALCVPLQPEAASKERLASRAVELLSQAIDRGFRNVGLLQQASDLNSLRSREDFSQLLRRLPASPR